jgi:hypothetical protein
MSDEAKALVSKAMATIREAAQLDRAALAQQDRLNAKGPPQTSADLHALILVQAERVRSQSMMILGLLDHLTGNVALMNEVLKRVNEPVQDDPYGLGIPESFDVDGDGD